MRKKHNSIKKLRLLRLFSPSKIIKFLIIMLIGMSTVICIGFVDFYGSRLFGVDIDYVSGSELSITKEVEAYRYLVLQYCVENEIPEYVDIVLCIIQQESGGKGIDIMQCAESGGGVITTPEDSIRIGVAYFKQCLVDANMSKEFNLEVIKLALQGYNFGRGYISWALSYTNGYSLDSAQKFSDMKKHELGWENYGDVSYVPHVLRYYSKNGGSYEGASSQIQQLIEIAAQQIGKPYVWGATGPNSFDCSGLVQWCYKQIGVEIGRTTWDQNKNGIYISKDEIKPGDIILMHTMNGTPPTHVGIYIGNGKIIHALNSRVGVIVSNLNSSYYESVYFSARRILI